MSNAALKWAWEQEGLTLAERLVLLYLADRYNDEQELAWPLQSEIVSATKAGLRTVQWCMARLQEKGLVSIVRRGTKNSAPGYHLNIDSQPATIAHRENLNTQPLRTTRNQPAMVAANVNVNPQTTTCQPAMVASQPANDDVEYKEYIPKEPKRTQRYSKTSASGKKLWEPPAWWTPLMTLNGYVAKDYSKRAQGVSEACLAHQVEPAKVITGFAYDWPTLKIRYGWDNPVAVLQGKPLQIAIEKAKGQQPWLLSQNGANANGTTRPSIPSMEELEARSREKWGDPATRKQAN